MADATRIVRSTPEFDCSVRLETAGSRANGVYTHGCNKRCDSHAATHGCQLPHLLTSTPPHEPELTFEERAARRNKDSKGSGRTGEAGTCVV